MAWSASLHQVNTGFLCHRFGKAGLLDVSQEKAGFLDNQLRDYINNNIPGAEAINSRGLYINVHCFLTKFFTTTQFRTMLDWQTSQGVSGHQNSDKGLQHCLFEVFVHGEGDTTKHLEISY